MKEQQEDERHLKEGELESKAEHLAMPASDLG